MSGRKSLTRLLESRCFRGHFEMCDGRLQVATITPLKKRAASRQSSFVCIPRSGEDNLTRSARTANCPLTRSVCLSGPPSAAPRINNNHSAVAGASPGHKDARPQGHKDVAGGGGGASASAAGSRYSAAGGTGSAAAARPATASAVTKTSAAGMDSSRKYQPCNFGGGGIFPMSYRLQGRGSHRRGGKNLTNVEILS